MSQADVNPDELPVHDFNLLLHELRTREIRKMPSGARRFLSAGCSGSWYFNWIRDNYPGALEVHHGVEAYSPCPPDLPAHVRWVSNTIGQMHDIPGESVDLVFAGQTLEHVWPPDLAGFLLEAHRVLAPGGHVVADSPNRVLTRALGWVQPQHTAELTVPEIVELLELAGFEEIRLRGIWLCYDRREHRVLPLLPPTGSAWTGERRAAEAVDHPEDSFIWWAEARKGGGTPDVSRLQRRAAEIYNVVSAGTFGRVSHEIGACVGHGPDRIIEARAGEEGVLLCGGRVPVPPGVYRARFELRRNETTLADETPVALLDVHDACENEIIVVRVVTAGSLPIGRWCVVDVPVELTDARFGVEVRVHGAGRCPLDVRLAVDFRACDRGEEAVAPRRLTERERRLARRGWELLGAMAFLGGPGIPLRYRIADRVYEVIEKAPRVKRLLRRLAG